MIVRMICAALLLLTCLGTSQAQVKRTSKNAKEVNVPITLKGTIVPLPIEISGDITSNLIFPFSIVNVDLGSRAFIAQKPKGSENILQVKAMEAFTTQTNLTVVTSDGGFYSFLVSYAPRPQFINLKVREAIADDGVPPIELSTEVAHENVLQETASKIALKLPVSEKSVSSSDVTLKLSGIYISGDVLYFRLVISNDGLIPYDVSQLRFFIKDKKTGKRTASQENELMPLVILGEKDRVGAGSSNTIVVGISKFTIVDKKRFHIQLMEKDGGRHAELKINNRNLIGAKSP